MTAHILKICILVAILPAATLKAQNSAPTSSCSSVAAESESISVPGGRPAEYDRAVSWESIIPNILCDQKSIWLFPTKLGEDRNWVPALSVAGTTAGLFTADPVEASYFHQTSTFRGFNGIFTSNATLIGTIVAPVSLYAAGLLRKDTKMQHTALLAGEAVADA